MSDFFKFVGEHPIISIILAGIIGDCVVDVAAIIKGKDINRGKDNERISD